jgi:hypothetical protein
MPETDGIAIPCIKSKISVYGLSVQIRQYLKHAVVSPSIYCSDLLFYLVACPAMNDISANSRKLQEPFGV